MGGILEIQEMLDFVVEKNVQVMIEKIFIDYVNEVFVCFQKNDVCYCFVVDIENLFKF